MDDIRHRRVYRYDYEMLVKMHGTTCRICGAEPVQYHHIIPVSWGGSDDINNFLPLCSKHHAMVHGVMELGRYNRDSSRRNRSGRPRKLPDDWEHIIERYIRCEIGTSECKALLGVSENTKLRDAVWLKEFVRKHGIKDYKNGVDILWAKGTLVDGCLVGRIEFIDGGVQDCLWDSVGKDFYDKPKKSKRKKKK